MCPKLSNELSDAALFEHFAGDDTAAIETIRDQLHLADSIVDRPEKKVVFQLAGSGVQNVAVDKLEIITSNVVLTNATSNQKRLQTSTARELIRQLLGYPDP